MQKPWTELEDELLIKYYPTEGKAVADILGRTRTAVKDRAQQLGILNRQSMDRWTDEEIKILVENYPTMGKKVLSLLPNKSVKSVQMTAYRLNIHKNKKES